MRATCIPRYKFRLFVIDLQSVLSDLQGHRETGINRVNIVANPLLLVMMFRINQVAESSDALVISPTASDVLRGDRIFLAWQRQKTGWDRIEWSPSKITAGSDMLRQVSGVLGIQFLFLDALSETTSEGRNFRSSILCEARNQGQKVTPTNSTLCPA